MTCLGSKKVKHGYQFCKTSRFLVVFWILNFKYCLKTDQTIFPLCQMPYNTRNIKKINAKWPKIPKVSPPTHTPITIKRRSRIFFIINNNKSKNASKLWDPLVRSLKSSPLGETFGLQST